MISYVPWHLLAGRPNPGLLIDKAGPPTAQWGGQYDDLAARYEAARKALQDEVGSLLPAALRSFVLGDAPASCSSRQGAGSAASDADGFDPDDGDLSVPGALRHAWSTSRAETKSMVVVLARLRLSSAAVGEARRLREEGGADGAGRAAAAGSEPFHDLEAAAAHVVGVARLTSGAEGGELVASMFTVMRTLGRKRLPEVGYSLARLRDAHDDGTDVQHFHARLNVLLRSMVEVLEWEKHTLTGLSHHLHDHQAVTQGLLLWGWDLVQSADKRGGAAALRASGVLSMLADDGSRPPKWWREPVFRLLFNSLVTNGDPREMAYLLRLMAAMGHLSPDYAWWDRFLIRMYYLQSSGRARQQGQAGGSGSAGGAFLSMDLEEIREAATALVAASTFDILK